MVLLLGVGVLVVGIGTGSAKDEDDKDEDAGAKCSDATLDGTYLFAINGVDITGGDQIPFAGAGYEVFDGNGNIEGVSSGNTNGQTFRNEPFSGTYTVKADCTGTITYNGGDPAVYDLFIAPDGSMFTFVRIKAPEQVIAAFELRGTAKRVGDD